LIDKKLKAKKNDKKKIYFDGNRSGDASTERIEFARAGSSSADAHRRIPLRQLSV